MGLLKLVVPFLLLVCLFRSGPVYGQPTRLITLTVKDVPFKKAFDEIRTQAHVGFLSSVDWEHLSRRVSFSVRGATLTEALDSCFKDQPFTYKVVNEGVAILPFDHKEKIVHGQVVNDKNEPLAGVTIVIRGEGGVSAISGEDGKFALRTYAADPHLVFSSVNYETQIVRSKAGDDLRVQLQEKINELMDVVILHTGYQDVHRRSVAGSFDDVDNDLINRRVSPNILDRINGVTSGVLFNTNIAQAVNQSTITIRGRSTIFSNPNPLVVIDNFPYAGDVNNINPDDVESITILKDAAAAAIWGALSGNGVIVITTKKGKLNSPMRVSFNTSQTVGAKPNLYYLPILSSNDYINVEEYLFHQGYYNSNYENATHPALTPVQNLLFEDSLGQISAAQAQSQINALRGQDYRPGLNKYFYQPSLNSQVSLNLSGGGDHNMYFLSAGYDRDLSNLDRNNYSRVTLNGNNTYYLLHDRLELNTDLVFTASTTVNDNQGGTPVNYPYWQVADAHGNPLPVALGLNEPYIDTAGGGQLLDWHYRPLQELQNADNPTKLTDYRIDFSARYKIWRGLDIRAYYELNKGTSDNPDYMSQQTYYTRNMINEYTQDNNGSLSYPVPLGGILTESISTYTSNNVRVQANYNDSLFRHGRLNLIGGAEVRDIEGETTNLQLFGYDPSMQIGTPVDYTDFFTQYSSGAPQKIQYLDSKLGTSERYISYYGNGTYSYLGRYLLSASARRDESNLFGVNTNQRGVPLWSTGASWEVSRESFYHLDWLPLLRLRVTDGYNGNVDRSVSAYTTANVNAQGNTFGAIDASIINPPNADLRWEKIHVYNFGTDFALRGDQFGGTLEYYIKAGLDLIGESPVDPTTGVTSFTGNTANILDHGVDLSLHTNNSFGAVRWNSILLFSYVRDKVTKYDQQLATVYDYFTVGTLNPLVGRPLYSVYAVKWEGLDHQNGNPQGYLNGTAQSPGQVTENYGKILSSPDLSNLIYKGPVNPPYFGSWRNNIYWRQWGLSCNVIYKMGYVFRRSSIDYTYLFDGSYPGHPDYDRRWQNPGDELHTNVPSFPASVAPAVTQPRDNFYTNSEVLVEKGDQVRLQDVQLTYDLSRQGHPKLPAQLLRFYVYANNLGILWKANHSGIDPDFISTMPNPRTLALGVKANF
jgi:TonB-linked SusC/RagA family outer membrane protein